MLRCQCRKEGLIMMFVPSDGNEELLVLAGRVQAFAEFVNRSHYSIPRELCADMLGFELKKENTEDEGKNNSTGSNLRLD